MFRQPCLRSADQCLSRPPGWDSSVANGAPRGHRETIESATAILAKHDLKCGACYTTFNNSTLRGRVVDTDPPPGTSLKFGESVLLQVSLGPTSVEVPDVITKTQADAETIIKSKNLQIGPITARADKTVQAGLVICSVPASKTLVTPDSAISLELSLGPPKPVYFDAILLLPDENNPTEVEIKRHSPANTIPAEMLSLAQDVFAVEEVINTHFSGNKYNKYRVKFFHGLKDTAVTGLIGSEYDVSIGRVNLLHTKSDIASLFPQIRDAFWWSYFWILLRVLPISGSIGCIFIIILL